ncbi:unnamed protein product, partial [Mesorhabditis belari]|uniref:Phosphoserine phosphatase n=1 Tax=Mesorhabditis belari TaxID=2138241 RepID=A0AAF3EQ00_9BILA
MDSTLCMDESQDELARYLNIFDRVEALTKAGMNGSVPFKESISRTMSTINPTKRQYETFLKREIKKRRVDVYLVTGGFYDLACLTADLVGIEKSHIFCNTIHFDNTGKYVHFTDEKLSNGLGKTGKAAVMELLKRTKGYKNLVMIGDGANDLEASPPADAFIGFGGNIIRESIKRRAGWFVMDFATLQQALRRMREMPTIIHSFFCLFVLLGSIRAKAEPVPRELQCHIWYPRCAEGWYCAPVWVCSENWCPTQGKCTQLPNEANTCDLTVTRKNLCGLRQFCAKVNKGNTVEGRCVDYFPGLQYMGSRPRRDGTCYLGGFEGYQGSSSENESSSDYSPGPSNRLKEKEEEDERNGNRRRSLRSSQIGSIHISSSSSSKESSIVSSPPDNEQSEPSRTSSRTQTIRSSASLNLSREISCEKEDPSQTWVKSYELRKSKSCNGLRVRIPKRGGSPPLTVRRRAEQAAQAAASSFQAAFTLYKCIRRPFLLRNHVAFLSKNQLDDRALDYDFTQELPPKLLKSPKSIRKQKSSFERRESLNDICYLLGDRQCLDELKKLTACRTSTPFNFSIGTLAQILKNGDEMPMRRCSGYMRKLMATKILPKSEPMSDLELRDICVKLRHVHVPAPHNENLEVQCFLSLATFPMGTMSEPIPIDGIAPIENNIVFREKDGVTILLRSGNEAIDFEKHQLSLAALIFKVDEKSTGRFYYGAQAVYEANRELIELKTHEVRLIEQETVKKFLPRKHLSEITEAADLMVEVERNPHLYKAIKESAQKKSKQSAHLIVNFIDLDTEFGDDREEEEPIREKSLTSKGCVPSCPIITMKPATPMKQTEEPRRSLKREIPETSSPPPLKRNASVASSMGSNGNKKNSQNGSKEKNEDQKAIEPMEELKSKLDRMDHHAWLFKDNSLAFLEYFDPMLKPGIEGRLENITKIMKYESMEELQKDAQILKWLRFVLNPGFPALLIYEFYACTRKNVKDLHKVLFHGRNHPFLKEEEMERIFKEGVRRMKADHPEKCVLCGRSSPNLFSLLLHYHTSYPRFSIKIRLDPPSDEEYIPEAIFLEVCLDDSHSDECVLPSERDLDQNSTINRPQRLPKFHLTRAQTSHFKKELRMDNLLFTTISRPRAPVRFNHTVYANERWNSAFASNAYQIARKMMFEYSMMCLYDYIDIDPETLRYMGLYNFFRWRVGPNFQKSPHHALRLFFIANYRALLSFGILDRFHVHLLEIKNLRQITDEQMEDLEYMLTETADEDPSLHLNPLQCPFSYYRLSLLKRADEIFLSNEKKSFKGLLVQEDPETTRVMNSCVKVKVIPSQLSREDREILIQAIDSVLPKNDQLYLFKANSSKVITGVSYVPESLFSQNFVLHYGVLFNATYHDQNLPKQDFQMEDVPILKLPEYPSNIKRESIDKSEILPVSRRCSKVAEEIKIEMISRNQVENLLHKGFTFPCTHKRPCLCESRYIDDGFREENPIIDSPIKQQAQRVANSSPFKLYKQRL